MSIIPNHQRMVIVLGMARSGTTVFTYILAKHPEFGLFRAGSEAWVLENACIPDKNISRLKEVAELYPARKYVLLKRPWQEKHAQWFKEVMPNARYIIMLRERDGIMKSWNGSGNWAIRGHNGYQSNPEAYYEEYRDYALSFPDIFGPESCQIIRYEELLNSPSDVFKRLSGWLEVEDCFNVSLYKKNGHWDRKRSQEFPKGISEISRFGQEEYEKRKAC